MPPPPSSSESKSTTGISLVDEKFLKKKSTDDTSKGEVSTTAKTTTGAPAASAEEVSATAVAQLEKKLTTAEEESAMAENLAAAGITADQAKEHLFGKYRYCCKKCRCPLYVSDEIVPHDKARGAKGHKKFKHQNFHVDTDGAACTSHFLDPDVSTWVSEDSRKLHEELENAQEDAEKELEKQKNDALKRGDFETYLKLEGVGHVDDDKPASDLDDLDDEDWDEDDELLEDSDEEIIDDEPKKKGGKKGAASNNKQKNNNKKKAPQQQKSQRQGMGPRMSKMAQVGPAGTAVPVEAVAETIVDPDTIYCPNQKCKAKIGAQCWTGSQCSCGAWVTPSFKVHMSKVDAVPLWV